MLNDDQAYLESKAGQDYSRRSYRLHIDHELRTTAESRWGECTSNGYSNQEYRPGRPTLQWPQRILPSPSAPMPMIVLARQAHAGRPLLPAYRYGLAATAGLLLALPCLVPSLFITAWFGLVPLLFAICGATLRQSYALGAIAGFVFWAIASYWMAEFIGRMKGYDALYNQLLAALFWLYCGQVFGLIAAAWRWLQDTSDISDLIGFPILFVAVFVAFPMLFHMRLGESQSAFLAAIQGADIVGASGIDFVIVLANVMLYRLLSGNWRKQHAVAIAAIPLLLWFGYGMYALRYWDGETANWPSQRIGIVQPNDPVSLAIPPPAKGYSRSQPPELEMTAALAHRGATLVIWPEARYKGFFDHRIVRYSYREQIAALGIGLLFHDVEREHRAGSNALYNSAVLLDADGQPQASYRKIKRVAFGEYLPLIGGLDFLRSWVQRSLGGFLREIAPGSEHKTFTLVNMKIVPKICYESAFSRFIADSIGSDGQGKMLVVLSQDGWFGESKQPFQHFWSASLRAVENRVPLVHVINNGPSGAVLPSGKVAHQLPPFSRRADVIDLPHSPDVGGSFYSRNPGLFLYGIYAASAGLLLAGIYRRGRSRLRLRASRQ